MRSAVIGAGRRQKRKDGAEKDRSDPYDLNLFISAQEGVLDRALGELRDGLKR